MYNCHSVSVPLYIVHSICSVIVVQATGSSQEIKLVSSYLSKNFSVCLEDTIHTIHALCVVSHHFHHQVSCSSLALYAGVLLLSVCFLSISQGLSNAKYVVIYAKYSHCLWLIKPITIFIEMFILLSSKTLVQRVALKRLRLLKIVVYFKLSVYTLLDRAENWTCLWVMIYWEPILQL